ALAAGLHLSAISVSFAAAALLLSLLFIGLTTLLLVLDLEKPRARAEEDARIRRKRFLGLYVSAANQGARRLYLRAGFAEHHKRRSLLAGWLLRQRVWIYMRKDVVS
ncbi:MAG TPA: hypothetical protein VFO07_18605, partial [Roseiflexaceae bacterium]|nr:hypothetical protein [Roseiflexaceae bacterium]